MSRRVFVGLMIVTALMGGCGTRPVPSADVLASRPAPTSQATARPGPTPTLLTPEPTSAIDDTSVYGVMPVSRSEVVSILTQAYSKLRCDHDRVWDAEEPAADGTPWEYQACWIRNTTGATFITDPHGRLRSAGAISVFAAAKDLPFIASLMSAAAGPVGVAVFPQLQSALKGGHDTIMLQDGYRFEVWTPSTKSWTVDVTTSR